MPEPDASGGGPHRKKHDAFDWAGLVIGILTLIAVGTYTGVQICQTQLTRQAIEISTRPYIEIALNPGSFGLGPNGVDYRMSFVVGNYGKLPAKVNIQAAFRWQNNDHPRGSKGFNSIAERLIFPDEDHPEEFWVNLPRLSDGQVADLKKDGGNAFVDIMVRYNGYQIIFCTSYNITKGSALSLADGAAYEEPDCNTAN